MMAWPLRINRAHRHHASLLVGVIFISGTPVRAQEVPAGAPEQDELLPETMQPIEDGAAGATNAPTRSDRTWDSARDTQSGEDLSGVVRVEDIVEPPAEYHYAAFGRPDPFQPPSAQLTQQMRQARGGELQYGIPVVNSLQVPLDQLTVRGIWQLSNGERRALVIVLPQDLLNAGANGRGGFTQRPLGGRGNAAGEAEEGVVAKVGDPIGPSGKILEILSDRVVTRQYKLQRDGVRAFDDISLFLGGPDAVQRLDADKTYVLAPGKDPQLDVRSSSAEFMQKFGAPNVRIDPKSNQVIEKEKQETRQQ